MLHTRVHARAQAPRHNCFNYKKPRHYPLNSEINITRVRGAPPRPPMRTRTHTLLMRYMYTCILDAAALTQRRLQHINTNTPTVCARRTTSVNGKRYTCSYIYGYARSITTPAVVYTFRCVAHTCSHAHTLNIFQPKQPRARSCLTISMPQCLRPF